MIVSLIVAVAENGVIGADNALPWRLPDDMKWFRRHTLGKPVVMGRKTFESIGSRPLPERPNIVMTRDPSFAAPGCAVVDSPQAALAAAGDSEEVMVIGGESVFRAFLARADRLYLTRVNAVVEGDTLFPDTDAAEWREVLREEHPADLRHAHAFTILILERRSPGRARPGAD